jgi:hypothetical protein
VLSLWLIEIIRAHRAPQDDLRRLFGCAYQDDDLVFAGESGLRSSRGACLG